MSDNPISSRSITEKRRALLQKMAHEDKSGGVTPAIPRYAAGDTPPLSFAQERLWFLDQLQPNSPAYNVPAVFPLAGPIETNTIRRSLQSVIQRHEILRTTFRLHQGQPVQVVAAAMPLDLREINLHDLPDGPRQAELQRLISEEGMCTFDLARGPLLRTTLVHGSPGEHYLLVTMHHIVTDAWSMQIFYRELAAFYESHSTGKPLKLPDLPIQYGDFAKWQRALLQGATLEKLLSYWKQKLAGIPAVTAFPTNRTRPAVRRLNGATYSFTLPSSLSSQLRNVAQQEQATLFMVMLAGFKALLRRYMADDDVVVGTPIASRNHTELEGLIGLFLNTLVLRTDLSGEPGFRQVVRRVRDVCLEAFMHENLPFERLVEELQPERNVNVTPLFQIFFVFQSAPQHPDNAKSPEADQSAISAHQPAIAKFDLSLYLTDTGQTIQGAWEYDCDLFDSSTIVHLTEHFQVLLQGAVNNPDSPVTQLPLLTSQEQRQFALWNANTVDNHVEIPPHELFEAQVCRTPDATALVFGYQQLTYSELNRKANQLARRLRKLGVGPDVAVGICVERSLEMVYGVLAILKAGGVHVPLDPSYPPQRLAFMLSDMKSPVLLTQKRLIDVLPQHNAEVIMLDACSADIAAESGEDLVPQTCPENLAYIIYTSGSTGRPKGVGMSLRTLSNLIHWQNGIASLSEGARTLQFTSFSFDVSILEILSTLTSAGTLVIVPNEARTDVRALIDVLDRHHVERLFMPFTALQHLAEESMRIDDTMLLSLKQVISTGEALHITQPVASFFKRIGRCRLHNEYGPTETHFVTEFTLPEQSPDDWPPVPSIGRCIANAEVYILDEQLQRVPVGVVGELFAGGMVVARGYIGRPALTAEKFIPDPFSGRSGAYLYRTGDLARFSADGNIEFLGRSDYQIKVRGFRIEPGEIEVVLSQHPSVQEAVVVADATGGKHRLRLVAYVVSKTGEAISVPELRRFSLERLPEYMVPSTYVSMERFPLGATGKVDRLRLPRADAIRPELGMDFVAPRTPFEEQIAQLFAEVLGIDRVGIHDNFFELGGHSLLVVQLANRIREVFNVSLQLVTIFESPTVAGLANAIVSVEVQQSNQEDLAEIMAELEGLSPEESQHLLHEKPTAEGSPPLPDGAG